MTPTSVASPTPAVDDERPPSARCASPAAPASDAAGPLSPGSIGEPMDGDHSVNVAAVAVASMLPNHLAEREPSSPRCQSRESIESTSVPARCPSGESIYSERGGMLRGAVPLPTAALSPLGVALPATLPPAAAAALLPPNSAAMAAYLGAASHRLMMTSPLPAFARGPVSPLVTSSSSPPGCGPLVAAILRPPVSPAAVPLPSPIGGIESGILDFSTKKTLDVDSDVMNLSKSLTPSPAHESSGLNGPLDLSVSSRKRSADEPVTQPAARKSRPAPEYKPVLPQWPSPVAASHLPYFAAAVAAASTLSPKINHLGNHGGPENAAAALWNGKLKQTAPTPNDATKALEKMSELSKLGGEDLFRSMAGAGAVSVSGAASNSASSRHSAWQSHWLNKGADQAKDVLKCVWCKQSFPSLAAMTTHMKEAKHCGVNVPVPQMQPTSVPAPQHAPPVVSAPPIVSCAGSSISGHASSNSCKTSQSDLNLLIKETMPLPRKLVRGQDVWLGKGAEQTRQILKCMWCGQSFRSLAEMTSHMQQTQHYTNIISQEQIISWKSSDDPKGGGGGGPGGGSGGPGGGASGASSHVSAVLTCKVCDQAFSSLKELSNHMVKNSHYKEHIMRSITESGGRRRQTREKRKKSLPVRKLLELERAQHDFKNGDVSSLVAGKIRDPTGAGRITCEKCGDKIETSIFVEHIRQCVGGGSLSAATAAGQRNFLKSALLSNNIIPPENPLLSSHESRKSTNDESPSPGARQHRSPSCATDLSTNTNKDSSVTEGNSSSPSVLNAIEKLIEKSFDSRSRQSAAGFPGAPGGPSNAPIGSSILKRLGIDESVDYTKPLVDPQTMNILRSYHHQSQHAFARRERSGSESSSVSERGSSRVDSLTPDRKMEPPGPHMTSTPRTTPDKRVHTPSSDKLTRDESPERDLAIKKELDDGSRVHESSHHPEPNIKREEYDDGEDDERNSYHSNGGGPMAPRMSTDSRADEQAEEESVKHGGGGSSSVGAASPLTSPRQPTPSALESGVPNSPCRNSTCSPASSDRSGTPRSTNGSEKKAGGSLGALSSMFDSLSGVNPSTDGSGSSSGRRASSHPLAALQKLCDKTETHHGGSSGRASASTAATGVGTSGASASGASSSTSANSSGTAPGAILAFSWACNDAVMTSDSIMKCALCDTPFISKGAYRHHLSKMHFVKDGVIPDPVALKVQQQHLQQSQAHQPPGASGGGTSGDTRSGKGAGSSGGSRPPSKSPPAPAGYEESPHSKFLKYTELAKQLSSKYV